jgi:hypothetical protein
VIRSPYSDYDVLDEFEHWDAKTQAVIHDRIHHAPEITFFTLDEARLLTAIVDRIIPQDDRPLAKRVPIVPFIGRMLAQEDTDGFREPDMPWDQEMWRLGLAGIEEASQAMHQRGFLELGDDERDAVLTAVQAGEPPGEVWTRLPAKKFFKQLVQQAATVYYAHPVAWSEIGWGGPASPRGYVRTGYGMRDAWEPAEGGEASSVTIVQRRTEGQGTASGSGGATH